MSFGSSNHDWDLARLPDQHGRTVVVTGGATGIGRAVASAFAERGANVVVTSRDPTRAPARDDRFSYVELDLEATAAVHAGAERIRHLTSRIDVLVNNAGVMSVPYRSSPDGHEVTFATNHLGHFALTGLLLDRLMASTGSRVVTVASNAHRRARLAISTLESDLARSPGAAYDLSKLANLLFSYELDRRLRAAAASTVAVAAHPGVVRTGLWRTSSALERALLSRWARTLTFWFAQDSAAGALPVARAAGDPAARGGEYYGPGGRGQNVGHPVVIDSSAASHDRRAQSDLWAWSERATGVAFDLAS